MPLHMLTRAIVAAHVSGIVLAVALGSASAQTTGNPIIPEPPRALTDRGLVNVVAFARLLGYVEYFHPSDEASDTDWSEFAIEGMRRVEAAPDAASLITVLNALFQPIAPTVRVYPSGTSDLPPLPPLAAGTHPAWIVRWHHTGVGAGYTDTTYHSDRVYQLLDAPATPAAAATPEAPFIADLGGGVSVSLPLAVYADARQTLPRSAGLSLIAPASYTARDRATRLADVALAWNIFDHFYPYSDVVTIDWLDLLARTLREAATDKDDDEFLKTLQRLDAVLQDGHGNVWLDHDQRTQFPPFTIGYVENKIVVLALVNGPSTGLKPGDVIVNIDGRPAADVFVEAVQLTSGATLQWRQAKALSGLLAGVPGSNLTLDVISPSGPVRTLTVGRTASSNDLNQPAVRDAGRPDKVAQIAPGVVYLDMDRVNDADIHTALPQLEAAKGIIIDVRGYPAAVQDPMALFTRMSDQPLTSAFWLTPSITLPDHKNMAFTIGRWPFSPPTRPRFTAKIAFLISGGDISFAESCLEIVQNYKLGDLVGGPTAGTNGNINMFALPGGYVVVFTGLKVLNFDGSQQHGDAIAPTIPIAPTIGGIAAGRDEALQKALEVVQQN
jgi:hypothetical protein